MASGHRDDESPAERRESSAQDFFFPKPSNKEKSPGDPSRRSIFSSLV